MVHRVGGAPLPHWSPGTVLDFGDRVAVVALVVFVLVRVPEAGVAALSEEAAPYWLAKLLLDVVVLGYVASRSRWTGAKLWAALWLVYAGLQTVSLVEVYLYGMVDATAVVAGTGRNLIVGGVVVLAVVAGFGRLQGAAAPVGDDRLRLSAAEWAWKLAVLALAFLVLMIVAGLVVFEGLAAAIDPAARAGYDIVEPPAWILPFQLVRGVAFTAVLLPAIALFGGGYRETQLAVAATFAVLLASNMIAGYDAVPGLLWVAHFFELLGQAFVYGLLAVALLFRSHRPLAWLRGRRNRSA